MPRRELLNYYRMNSESNASKKPVPDKGISLGRVLNQSEEIKDSVEEAASDLAAVNLALKQDGKAGLPVQTVEEAVAQNEEVQQKVAKAADDLDQVNAELAKEVAERIVIESELADTKTELAEAREDLATSEPTRKKTRHTALQDRGHGLPNRVLFEQRLDHGLSQAKRHGWGLAVMFIESENFKSINDAQVMIWADKVLLTVANAYRLLSRGEDTVSRWGGDEFVCILVDVKQSRRGAHRTKMVDRIAEGVRL